MNHICIQIQVTHHKFLLESYSIFQVIAAASLAFVLQAKKSIHFKQKPTTMYHQTQTASIKNGKLFPFCQKRTSEMMCLVDFVNCQKLLLLDFTSKAIHLFRRVCCLAPKKKVVFALFKINGFLLPSKKRNLKRTFKIYYHWHCIMRQ